MVAAPTGSFRRRSLIGLAVGLLALAWVAVVFPPTAAYSSTTKPSGLESRSCESVWTQMTAPAPHGAAALSEIRGPLGSACSVLSIQREHDAIAAASLAAV